jgi:putative membrane protein
MIATVVLPIAQGEWNWNGHMDGGWWIVMMVGMVLFWALVIVGVVWVVRELGGSQRRDRVAPDALAVLDRRLAEGAISTEEYRERRDVLTGSRSES